MLTEAAPKQLLVKTEGIWNLGGGELCHLVTLSFSPTCQADVFKFPISVTPCSLDLPEKIVQISARLPRKSSLKRESEEKHRPKHLDYSLTSEPDFKLGS